MEATTSQDLVVSQSADRKGSKEIAETRLRGELLEMVFETLVDTLADIDEFQQASTTIFVVYAHDNDSTSEKAESRLVQRLIHLLQRLRADVLSDRSPLLRGSWFVREDGTMPAHDILYNQYCLLPKSGESNNDDDVVTSVDKVIFCSSEVLQGYRQDSRMEPYIQAIKDYYTHSASLRRGNEEDIDKFKLGMHEIVSNFCGSDGFHHVITEMAFLDIRAMEDPRCHSIIPVVLNGDEPLFNKLVLWIKPSKVSDHWVIDDSQILHNLFFRLLNRLFEDLQPIIKPFEDCYDNCVKSLLLKSESSLPSKSEFEKSMSTTVLNTIYRLRRDGLATIRTARKLQDYEIGQPSKRIFTNDENILLRSLSFPELNRRFNDVTIAEGSTCRWFNNHPSYKTWIHARSSLLWVKGHPGSGKSTLLKYAIPQENQTNDYIASFFFNGRGPPLEKSIVGLYRSLLHTLLPLAPKKHREIADIYRSKCDTQGEFDMKWSWHEKELERWLTDLFLCLSTHPVRIYVDAIDESGKEAAVRLVAYFQKVVSKVSESGGSLKVCLSCRHYPVLPGLINLVLNVEDENHTDIADYSRAGFASSGVTEEKAQILERAITEKANGIFQWAVIVVPRMIDLFHIGTKLQGILEVIKQLPEDLDELYREIMKTVPSHERHDTLLLIQWICCATRPLSLDEMRYATIITKDVPYSSLSACQEDRGFTNANSDMEKKIKHFARGLAEVKRNGELNWIQFIHQSVQDYFVASGLQLLSGQTSDFSISKAHFQLAWSCIRYIEMEELFLTRDEACTPEMARYRRLNEHEYARQLAETYPFAEYAASSWGLHTAHAESNVHPRELIELFDRLDPNLSPLLENWIFLVICNDKTKMPCSRPDRFTALHIMACYGLFKTMSNYLAQYDVEADCVDGYGRTPLSYAAMNGHEKVVELLLGRRDVAPDNHDTFNGYTPLSEAAMHGHVRIVQLLVSRNDVNVDSRDRLGRTALSHAAERGANSVVQLLMERNDVTLDSMSHDLRTPLFYAARYGHAEVVRLLIGHRDVDPDFVAPHSTWPITPLMVAAEHGHKEIVQILLRTNRVDVDFVGHEGRTAISYAATSREKDVIQLLIQHSPITLDWKDTSGQSPLSHATQYGRREVVELLVSRYDVDLNSRDKFERTPLSWAAGDGREEIVQDLLSLPGVDGDSRDNRGRTPLSYAAAANHVGIVEMLLRARNIDVNSADIDGRTPLSYAAREKSTSPRQDSAIISHEGADTGVWYLLQRREIEVDRPDKWGKTPLSWAAYGGNDTAVRLLLARKDVRINSRDSLGKTPLMNATVFGVAVIQLLLEHPDIDVNSRDENGETALSLATSLGGLPLTTEAVVQQLLNCSKVQIDTRDNEGRTPLSYAAESGRVEVVQLLIQSKGVRDVSKDKYGRTPFSYAAAGRFQAVMDLLRGVRR